MILYVRKSVIKKNEKTLEHEIESYSSSECLTSY